MGRRESAPFLLNNYATLLAIKERAEYGAAWERASDSQNRMASFSVVKTT